MKTKLMYFLGAVIVTLIVSVTVAAASPQERAPLPPTAANAPVESDVVLLALTSLERSEENHLAHTTRRLVGGAATNPSLLDVQMGIVQATADFGPVALLVPQ